MHRSQGGLERAKALLFHEALHVLEHDDGVVDDDTNGDDHRKEG